MTRQSVFSPPTQDGVEHLLDHLSPILTISSIKRETEAEMGSDWFHLLANNESNILPIFSLELTVFFQDNVQCYILSLIRQSICCLIP